MIIIRDKSLEKRDKGIVLAGESFRYNRFSTAKKDFTTNSGLLRLRRSLAMTEGKQT